MLKYIFLLLFASGLFFSCDSKSNTQNIAQSKTENDMAEMANDPSFVAVHQTPDTISPPAIGKNITLTVKGDDPANAYEIRAAQPTDKYLFVIHEWWGLNDHIRHESARLAHDLGDVHVIALDLYDGKVADNREDAGKYMQAADENRINNIIAAALDYAGDEAKIGTIGWCFGGGWSLKTSIAAGNRGRACVIYYGMPVERADQIAPLEAPVLGIFAQQDAWINEDVVKNFTDLAQATGKNVTTELYDADHAFANPSNPEYQSDLAAAANREALAFLEKNLD